MIFWRILNNTLYSVGEINKLGFDLIKIDWSKNCFSHFLQQDIGFNICDG